MSQLINITSLKGLSIPQLRRLHSKAQQELVQSLAGSAQRRESLAKLELISQALALSYRYQPNL